MSKNAPWVNLDPGTCAWAKEKMSDTSMNPAERAYVKRIHIHCGLSKKPPGDPQPPQRRIM